MEQRFGQDGVSRQSREGVQLNPNVFAVAAVPNIAIGGVIIAVVVVDVVGFVVGVVVGTRMLWVQKRLCGRKGAVAASCIEPLDARA